MIDRVSPHPKTDLYLPENKAHVLIAFGGKDKIMKFMFTD